jgi:hypothetical protein
VGGYAKREISRIEFALSRPERRETRHKAEAGRLRAEGVKAGVPDLCLPVARGQYHGLYIELKRQRGGRTSDHQSEWLDALSAQGYKAALCYGWEQAAGTIIEYLTGGGTHD